MFTIYDTYTGDLLEYEDVEDFRKTSKYFFDDSVHDAIDDMCDAYKRSDDISAYESYLGIRVITDPTLDIYDIMSLYR